jgi:peptide deformylase
VTVQGRDLLARCVQHETDHLDGVLFVDKLDPASKKAALEAIREADWGSAPTVRASPHPLFGQAL